MKTKPILIRNESPKKVIQALTFNLLPKLVRQDSMEDREFLVVPMVILTEGVHNGSEGPLYYPSEELGKTPVVWNHKPVVVYHPEMNGQGISACDPAVISARKVGVMMNTRFEKGRLKSEAWIEKDRANKVDDRIMAAVEKNEMMEVSTGVFVDAEQAEGEWKGEKYTAIARNFRPDHLAILPDKIGACSISDGAGFLRNQANDNPEIQKAIQTLQRAGLLRNEMSFSNLQSNISTALRERLGIKDNGPLFAWVSDVYSNFFVYEYDGKLYRLEYSASDTGVSLSDERPVEVKRVTEYRTVEGAFVGNQDQTQNKPNGMEKKQLVDAIILAAAALAGSWAEVDRDQLMAMNEDQLKMIQNKVGKAKEEPKTEPKKEEPVKNQEPKTEPKKEEPKIVSLQDYVQAAPKEIREVLNHGLDVYNEEKTKLIEAITANKNNPFSKQDLENRPLGELRGLARLAGLNQQTRVADYSGQAPAPAANAEVEEPLEVPALIFAK